MGRDFIAKFNMSSKMMFAPGVSMLEDCEGSMMWDGGGTGADWSVDFSDSDCLFGDKCLRLVTRVTDPDVGDLCRASRECPLPEAEVLVLAGRMAVPVVTKIETIEAILEWYEGGKRYVGAIKWYLATDRVGVRSSAGPYVDVEELGYKILANSWMDYRIVVDRGTKRYLYVEINGVKSIQSGELFEAADENDWRLAKTTMYVYTALAEAATLDFDAIYVGSHD